MQHIDAKGGKLIVGAGAPRVEPLTEGDMIQRQKDAEAGEKERAERAARQNAPSLEAQVAELRQKIETLEAERSARLS